MTKLALYAVIGASALGLLSAVFIKIRSDGYNAALTKVEKQNVEAAKTADKVRRTVAECHASAGVWDVITARCQD